MKKCSETLSNAGGTIPKQFRSISIQIGRKEEEDAPIVVSTLHESGTLNPSKKNHRKVVETFIISFDLIKIPPEQKFPFLRLLIDTERIRDLDLTLVKLVR